jgi:hypothetical protein
VIDQARGYKVCGRVNRFDEPCENRSGGPDSELDYGRRPCRLHGQKSRKGLHTTNYRTGEYSRYALSGRLGPSYQQELHDLDYISLREDIAVVKALLDEELRVLDDPTPPPVPLHLTEPCPVPLSPEHPDSKEQALLITAWHKRETARQVEIEAWHYQQATAHRKARELLLDKRRLTATEIHRVKLAEDTLSGQQVRLFGQTVLDTTRSRTLELVEGVRQTVLREARALGDGATAAELAHALDLRFGPALALSTVSLIQTEVSRAIAANRGENMVEAGESDRLLTAG